MVVLKSRFAVTILWVTFATAISGSGQFTLSIYQPGCALHGMAVNAAGGLFSLGGVPATYCPLVDQTPCPAGNQTVFAGMGALFVEVPGGQEVYMTSAGALSFTQAHSAAIPPNAYIGDFINVTVASDCSSPIYLINWQSPNVTGVITRGILACPRVSFGDSTITTYQIYANTPAFNQTNCLMVDGLLPTYNPSGSYGAWEYT